VTDQVGAGDDLIDPGVNGYVVPAWSAEALANAMRKVAAWDPEHWKAAAKRSDETLATCSIERGLEGVVHGCSLALEHRQRLARRRRTA
jgi:glycosyltransferase involved in cell wall biosynthesis